MRSHPVLALAILVVLIAVTSATAHFADARATRSDAPLRSASPGARAPHDFRSAERPTGMVAPQIAALATAPVPGGLVEAAFVGPRAHRHPGRNGDAQVWHRLRSCESDDNYAEDSGNGYYGAYQFAARTWWAIGFSGLPNDAAPAAQDRAARRLRALSGWSAWPRCATELGLLH